MKRKYLGAVCCVCGIRWEQAMKHNWMFYKNNINNYVWSCSNECREKFALTLKTR